jgi:hypothetical protein
VIRHLIAALLCRFDVHDLPAGFRRLEPDEPIPDKAWVVRCRWCLGCFLAVAEDPGLISTMVLTTREWLS